MIRKKNQIQYDYIIFVIFVLWLCISLFRTFFNFSKIFFEEAGWIYLSIDSKRERLFGNDYKLFNSINNDLYEESNVLLFSYDPSQYYFGRYVIYPRRLEHVNNIESFKSNVARQSHDLIILYKLSALDKRKSIRRVEELGIKKERIKIYE